MRRYAVSIGVSTVTNIGTACIYTDNIFILPTTREGLQVLSDQNWLCFQVRRVEIQREKERQTQWSLSCVYVCVSLSFCLVEGFQKIVQIPSLRDILRNLWMIYRDGVAKCCIKGLWNWSPHYHTNGLNLLSRFPHELWELRQWCYVSLVGYCLETVVVSNECFLPLHLFVYCVYKKTLGKLDTIQFRTVCLHLVKKVK